MSQVILRELKLNSAVKYVAREGFVNNFPITFAYDNPAQLQVFVGFKRVGEWDLQVLNGLPSVVLPEDLKVGQGIIIRRATPADGVPHTYQYKGNAQGGAEFSAKTIDENFEYMSNLVSEVEDYNTIAQDNLSDMESKFEETQDIANEAIRVADEAKDTADNAEQVALGIDGKAQEALDNSVEALGTANDAKTTALGIDGKAQEALDQSTTASLDASNALSIAQDIDGKAQLALDNSSEALGTANTALTVAQGIDDKAQEALDSIPTDYVKDSDFNALSTIVDNKRDLDDNVFDGHVSIKSDGTVRGRMSYDNGGLKIEQFQEDDTQQTFTFPKNGEGGEFVLKQELADPDKGVAMVGRGVVAVDSIADLLALPPGQRKSDLRYLVREYHAGSDVGGGEFYWDPDRSGENDGGTVINGFVRVFGDTVMLEQFGVSNGDTVNETLTTAVRVASDLRLPLRTSLDALELTGSTSISGVEYMDIDFGGCTFNCVNPQGTSYALVVSNAFRYIDILLHAPLMSGSTHMEIGDASGVDVGDIVHISSNEVYNPQRPDQFLVNNLFTVKEVVGNSVYFDRPVYNNFNTNTHDVRVEFTKPVKGGGIRNATFLGQGVEDSNGVNVLGPCAMTFSGLTVKDFIDHGLVLSLGFESEITRCRAFGIKGEVLGYGLMLNSCIRSSINNSIGNGCRHSIEVGGASEDCTIQDNDVFGDTSHGIASHGNARRVRFLENRIVRCVGGIVSRGIEPTIIGNTIIANSPAPFVIGEVGNPDRIGLAGIRAIVRDNTVVSLGGCHHGLYINTTFEDSVISNLRLEGSFSGNGVLVNGEKCENVSCSGIDTSKASIGQHGMIIDTVLPDSVDIVLRDCNLVANYDGLRVEGRCQGPNSEVRIFGGTCSGLTKRPFEMVTPSGAGSLKVLLVQGVTLRGALDARKPESVTEFSDLGNIGRGIF